MPIKAILKAPKAILHKRGKYYLTSNMRVVRALNEEKMNLSFEKY
jgi:hypothetical protein